MNEHEQTDAPTAVIESSTTLPTQTRGQKKFTSEYQPSPEAKSKGVKRHWEYRKARQQMFEKLTDIEMPNGSKQDFWQLAVRKLQHACFASDSPLREKEKIELICKIMKEFVPDDLNLDIDLNAQINIVFDKEDEKL